MGVKAFGILALLLLVSASFAADWPYWNEYTGNDLWAKLNVSVGSPIPNLYVYGGGSTNRSNGTATFLFFDDFEDASLSQWNLVGPGSATVASGCVYVNGTGGGVGGDTTLLSKQWFGNASAIGMRANVSLLENQQGIGYIFDNSQTYVTAYYYAVGFNGSAWVTGLGVAGTTQSNTSGSFHTFEIARPDEINQSWYVDGHIVQNITGTSEGHAINLSIYSRSVMIQACWAYARNVTLGPGPAIAYGAVENGSWAVSGETYTQRVQVNVSGFSVAYNDLQVRLNKSYLPAGANLLVTNSTPSIPTISITQLSPANGFLTQSSPIAVAYDVNFTLYTNVTSLLYLDGSVVWNNSTASNRTYNYSYVPTEGNHTWYVFAYNTSTITSNATSATRWFIYDTITPSGVQLGLTNNSWYYENLSINLTFTESLPQNCTVSINSSLFLMTQMNSTFCQYNLTSTAGNYSIFATVYDWLNHSNSTPTYAVHTYSVSSAVQNYSVPEFSGAIDNHTLNLTTLNYFGDVGMSLEYNGTNYTTNESNPSFAFFVGYRNLTAPAVSASTNVSVRWWYRFVNASNQTFATALANATIQAVTMTYCTSNTTGAVLNFTFYDQATPNGATLNSTMGATFLLHNTGGYAQNFSFNVSTAVPYMVFCLNTNATTYMIDSTQQFTSPLGTYDDLFYYLLNQTIGGTVYNVSLYNLASNVSVATQYSIIDSVNQPVTNAHIQIQRYYPSTNQLILVSMGKTNDQGVATSFAIMNTVNYRYVIIRDYGIIYTSNIAVLPCDPAATLCEQTLQVTNTTANEYTAYVGAAAVGCGYNSSSGNVYCTTNNPSGTATDLTLQLWQIGEYGDTKICENTLGAASGTVVCAVPDPVNTQYWFIGKAQLAGGEYVIGQGTLNYEAAAAYDTALGLLAASSFVIMGAGLGIAAGGVGVIIGALFGVIISVFFQFISIGVAGIVSLVLIGLGLIWVLSRPA